MFAITCGGHFFYGLKLEKLDFPSNKDGSPMHFTKGMLIGFTSSRTCVSVKKAYYENDTAIIVKEYL